MKLLPISLQSDPVVVVMFEAAIIQLQELYDKAMMVVDFVNIDKLPEDLLDLIAFEKHVDFYDNDLTIEQKRELIKTSISWHRKKGTRWAVENVVSIVYKNAQVYEWFEYEGDPYFFCIYVDEPFIFAKDLKRLTNLIDATKNKRSWLEYIAIKLRQTDYLKLEHFSYSYPNYYEKCGELITYPIHGLGIGSVIGLPDLQYRYPVYYDPSDTFNTAPTPGANLSGGVSLVEHQYDYPNYYPITNVVESEDFIKGAFTETKTNLQQTTASMRMLAPVCGIFTGGGM